tara:strand:+ start:4039 stop:6321 length:2283 start_codon:yes stop_codon:yes gene_type:complete
MADEAETKEPDARVAKLTGEIAQYERKFQKWHQRSKKVVQKYRGGHDSDIDGGTIVKFNILWSNVQTLVPATYSKVPLPDVSRMFCDNDPVGRVAALILERSLDYEVHHYPDYEESLKQCVTDRFLPGRGTAWVRYEPHFRAMQMPDDGLQVTDVIDEQQEELDYECSPVDYVHWEDFGHSEARTWAEVQRVWRCVYMYEDAVEDRFGEEMAKKIPYDSSPADRKQYRGGDSTPKQAKIYEIWDKETKTAIWLSKSLEQIIEERDDPLGLDQFWPCPKPLYATITNGTLVPVPDYKFYEEQAIELDILSDRIDGLIKALKVRGVYDTSIPELARLFTEGSNNDMIPVKNWQAFAEKNGLAGALDLVDLKPFADALKQAYLAFSQVKEYIYEITGISDIVRGESNPNETLGAQKIKQNFVGLRLRDMQAGVAKFAAEIINIKGQIICAKYSPQTIMKIAAVDQLSPADQQYIQPAMELLVGPERMADPEAAQGPNPTRQFRIDIESDSLVEMDQAAEKQDRLEFLKATGAFIKEAFPVIQASPQAAPLLVSMLKFAVTGFKVGRTIEGDFDMALDQLKQQAMQPQQPKPNPEMARVQAEQQTQMARLQADTQVQQAKLQADQQAIQVKMQADAQGEQMKQQAESDRHIRELQAQAQLARSEAQMQQDTELKKTALQVAGQIEVARINAESKDKADARASTLQGMQQENESAQADSEEQAGSDTNAIMQQLMETQSRLLETLSADKELVVQPDGRKIVRLVK